LPCVIIFDACLIINLEAFGSIIYNVCDYPFFACDMYDYASTCTRLGQLKVVFGGFWRYTGCAQDPCLGAERCIPKKDMLRILDTVSEKVTVWQGWIENKVNQKRFYFSWNTTTHYKICNDNVMDVWGNPFDG
jgi:hypothetical protein